MVWTVRQAELRIDFIAIAIREAGLVFDEHTETTFDSSEALGRGLPVGVIGGSVHRRSRQALGDGTREVFDVLGLQLGDYVVTDVGAPDLACVFSHLIGIEAAQTLLISAPAFAILKDRDRLARSADRRVGREQPVIQFGAGYAAYRWVLLLPPMLALEGDHRQVRKSLVAGSQGRSWPETMAALNALADSNASTRPPVWGGRRAMELGDPAHRGTRRPVHA
jgi:hypothetical protein